MPYAPSVICCTKCDTHKPVTEFRGELNTCRSCQAAYMREWYAKAKVGKLLEEVLAKG